MSSFYSAKIEDLLLHLEHIGAFPDEMNPIRGLEKGKTYKVCFYGVLDKNKTKIEKACFQVFGPTPLIAFMEFLCRQAEKMSLASLKLLTMEGVENLLQDTNGVCPFPVDAFFYLDIALSTLRKALFQCPYPSSDYPSWDKASNEEKKDLVEMILDKEVRPYLAFDQGGIQVISIIEDEVEVLYEGACSTCISSEGSTLNFVQEALRPLSPRIRVKVARR